MRTEQNYKYFLALTKVRNEYVYLSVYTSRYANSEQVTPAFRSFHLNEYFNLINWKFFSLLFSCFFFPI